MTWSFPVGVIAGTVVKIHMTFFLFLVWIGGMQWSVAGAGAALQTMILIVLIFACVLAHEFGHIFAARRYGIRTPEVILSPIGGIANMERIPEDPRQELVVALAGPAVNVVIAAVLFLLLGANFSAADLGRIENPAIGLLAQVAGINVILVLFNMLPAFPMDGGRVLRALLAMRMDYAQATRIAGRIGQAAAIGFAVLGLFWNPILILIAIFVYFAASAEIEHSAAKDLAAGIRVADAMVVVVETLPAHASLADAVDALVRTSQKEFPVVDGQGHPLGLLTREGLIAALGRREGPAPAVSDAMLPEIPRVKASAPLSEGMDLMMRSGAPALFALDAQDRLIGLLTRENIGEMVMVRQMRPDWRFRRA